MQHDMTCMPLEPALLPSFLILPVTSNKNVADVQTMKYGVGFISTAWGRLREVPVLRYGEILYMQFSSRQNTRMLHHL